MFIDRSTTIKALLDEKGEAVIEALVNLNKNFGKLKNPVLRKLLAKRVSIEDACRIAGCNVPDFLHRMASIGFSLKEAETIERDISSYFVLPRGLDIIDFDVRPILASDKDPLKDILQKLKSLRSNECLRVINSFEPTPLISLVRNKGFQTCCERQDPDLVFTYFFRETGAMARQDWPEPVVEVIESFGEVAKRFQGKIKTIDVTALDAPLPMHTILAELKKLKEDHALFVHHKKVPVYLLPHLHDEGFEFVIAEERKGKVFILIFKP